VLGYVIIYSQRLRNIHTLRDGGEAGVLSAWDEVGERDVVFKACRKGTPQRQKEAETLIRLSRQLGDSGFLPAEDVILDDDGISGFTLPLIEFGNLLDVAGQLEDHELLTVLQEVSQSLAYLHSLDYLHCDVKPDNIMVERTDNGLRPYVIDLGLFARRGAHHVTTHRGAPPYIAPEHLAGNPLSEASDIYSFGQLLKVLAPGLRSREIAGQVKRVCDVYTKEDPFQRPQSFWDVYDGLRRIQDRVFGASMGEVLPPPLRDTGVRLRVNNILQHVEDTDQTWRGLCLVSGAPGAGKSKIMREFVLNRQLAGDETIRVTGVQSLRELAEIVNSRRSDPRRARRDGRTTLWITAEADAQCAFAPDDLLQLHSAAINRRAVLLLEDRGHPFTLPSDDIRSLSVKPFSQRECIVASSHLQNDPSVSVVNGQALFLASAGNPWLLRQSLRLRLTGPQSNRSNGPVDPDRLNPPIIAYWRARFETLAPSLQALLKTASVFHAEFNPDWFDSGVEDTRRQAEMLEAAGWFQRTDSHEQAAHFRFVCRTARNFVRTLVGADELRSTAAHVLTMLKSRRVSLDGTPSTLWELHRLAKQPDGAPMATALWDKRRGLDDTKLAGLALLREYRRTRSHVSAPSALLPALISDACNELGSVQRRKHWATVALAQLPGASDSGTVSIDDAKLICHLYDLADQFEEKQRALKTLLDDGISKQERVTGYLLSELGTVFLLQFKWDEAHELYLQAHHLLERAADESAEYVRNLNRVGLSSMRRGSYLQARKWFERCSNLAERHGYSHITRLSWGNSSILERDMGDPASAMAYSRRALQSYRSARDTAGFLRALPDRVLVLVDLGEGYRALRVARSVVWLANLHSALTELGHAHNNLGWILMMQGEPGKAYRHLMAAARGHERTGDPLWVARSRLNLAWTYLLVGDLTRAAECCHSGLGVFEEHNDYHGTCEAMRILAQAAIMNDDPRAAEEHLRKIPPDNPRLSPRYRTETDLAWLNLRLWQEETSAAEQLITKLSGDPIVRNVHAMRCDFGRMRGMLYTQQGNFDHALDVLGATASACRGGGRIDKLIDTMIAQVMLAKAMHNWPVARSYLDTVNRMIDAMGKQLNEETRPTED